MEKQRRKDISTEFSDRLPQSTILGRLGNVEPKKLNKYTHVTNENYLHVTWAAQWNLRALHQTKPKTALQAREHNLGFES